MTARTWSMIGLVLSIWMLGVCLLLPALAVADPIPVHRIVLRFQQGSFAVLQLVPLQMVIAPSDELPAQTGPLSGFWYELRGPKQELRYRRRIANPVRLVSEDLRAGERHEIIPHDEVFTLLVPRANDGDELVLFSSPLEVKGGRQPALEVARIRLNVLF